MSHYSTAIAEMMDFSEFFLKYFQKNVDNT